MAESPPPPQSAPVNETVFGVHFAPLPKLTCAHLGWFWRDQLGSEWPHVVETVALPDQPEVFGASPGWTVPGIQFKIESAPSVRLQISNQKRDRMLQLQGGRLHYNWQKTDGPYPLYPALRDEFLAHYAAFAKFVEQASVGRLVPTQWELTYVDFEPPGRLWRTPAEWHKVLPGIIAKGPSNEATELEVYGGDWRYELRPRRGRLYIQVNLGNVRTDKTPGLMLQMTARGPISKESQPDLAHGLDFAHERITNAFVEITSPEARSAWGLDK